MNEDKEPAAPSYARWALLAAAVGAAAVIAFVTYSVFAARMPVCDPGFPARISPLPTWAFVLAAIAAFALGHASSQFAIRRQNQSQAELGEGRWKNESAAVAVHGAVAFFLFIVTILLVIEAVTLAHGHWPITYYARCATDAGPLLALLGSAAYAFVAGRWLWVFKG